MCHLPLNVVVVHTLFSTTNVSSPFNLNNISKQQYNNQHQAQIHSANKHILEISFIKLSKENMFMHDVQNIPKARNTFSCHEILLS